MNVETGLAGLDQNGITYLKIPSLLFPGFLWIAMTLNKPSYPNTKKVIGVLTSANFLSGNLSLKTSGTFLVPTISGK